MLSLLPLLAAATALRSTPDLGVAAGRCRADEAGPALLVTVAGLKDRQGRLKLEVYPSTDADFLADDNLLVAAGKTFRRVDVPVPQGGGNPVVCVRVPGRGAYSVSLLHDRDANRRFGWTEDGIGFSGNPLLGWGKPKAAAARAIVGDGITAITIVMNYRHGLSMAPLRQKGKG